ncbi:hypothetical protein DFJ67_6090 [Asanoa ferruginea]|uniref:Uncharacterized protein n=1 Tax=Asanoa ferruginea TaxID=53367 RepID=A0A3D9ZVG9_9ACTN|nr:hypothetical protein DFJ67_6090 [Asanoa ferruginea]
MDGPVGAEMLAGSVDERMLQEAYGTWRRVRRRWWQRRPAGR